MLTKATIIEYQAEQDIFEGVEYNTSRSNKLNEMALAGKTNDLPLIINDTTYKRLWTDQTAAEEWVNFITALAVTHNKTIVSAQIVDNP